MHPCYICNVLVLSPLVYVVKGERSFASHKGNLNALELCAEL